MGVHTTFVRSVDLDEWTQRQIDAMRLGGNANAREYFRKHGLTDMNTQIEKKYKSKAAQSYRKVLGDLVEAEAVKRGEVTSGATTTADAASSNGGTSSNSTNNPLMDSLLAADLRDEQVAARAAVASADNTATAQLAVAKAVQASQMHAGKGKLLTPPSSGNAPKIVLRKPSSGNSLGMFKKKPTAKSSGLRVSSTTSSRSNDGNSSDDGMEDIDQTMRKAKEADKEAAKAAVAQKQEATAAAVVAPAVAAAAQQVEDARNLAMKLEQQAQIANPPKPPPAATVAPKQTMADNLAKMKAGNSDFFAGL